jgi:hypothetical protein
MPVVDSRTRELDSKEIVHIAMEETGSKYSQEQVEAAILAEVNMPNAIPMREGNTMFIIHYVPKQRDRGLFRVLNADTAANYVNNTRQFLKAAGLMGFKILVVDFQTPEPLTLFKKIMRDPPFKSMGYTIQKSKDGKKYRATINMGNTGKGDKK